MIIRGYAVPFDVRVLQGDEISEAMARGTFADFIATGVSVPIVWPDHDGEHLGVCTKLFEDSYGLGFEFVLDESKRQHLRIAQAIVQDSTSCCSVMLSDDRRVSSVRNGAITDLTVLKSGLEHVAICNDDAAYRRYTGCWRSDAGAMLDRAPSRIRDLAQRWESGYEAASATPRQAHSQPLHLAASTGAQYGAVMRAGARASAIAGLISKGFKLDAAIAAVACSV